AQLSPTRDLVNPEGGVVMPPAERLRALEAYLASVRGIYTEDHPDVVRTKRTIAGLREQLGIQGDNREDLEQQLSELKTQREALIERYEPAHPDVVRLDERIAAVEASLRAGRDEPGTVHDEHADNPAYVQIQAQITSGDLDLRALTEQESELRKKMSDL